MMGGPQIGLHTERVHASFGIRAIAYHLPETVRSIEAWGQIHALSDERLARLSGNGVAAYHDGGDIPVREMAAAAGARTLRRAGVDPAEIDMLIFSHTRNHSVSEPPNSTASYLQKVLGIHEARCFSIAQQNCVSIFVALQLAQVMAASDARLRNVLIITADHVPLDLDYLRVIDDMAIHSDGACALLVTRDWPRRRILSAFNKSDARFYRADILNIEDNPDYYVSTVSTIRQAIAKSGASRTAISRVLPNHVNKPSSVRVAELMRMPREALYTANFASKGHVFGADPFINLVDSRPESGETVLLYSTGMAGCYGAAVVLV